MNTENRLREILAECQMRVNQVKPGFKVQLVEVERSEAQIQADIAQALGDRRNSGLSASNNFDAPAPATLDGVDQSTRDLIEAALRDSGGLEVDK